MLVIIILFLDFLGYGISGGRKARVTTLPRWGYMTTLIYGTNFLFIVTCLSRFAYINQPLLYQSITCEL